MAQNKFTQLNLGTDGNIMDETGITYPDGPTDRRRARVVISGDEIDKLSDVKNTQNTGSEYGLVTRVIAPWQGGLSYQFGFATISKGDPSTELVSYTVPADTTYYLTGLNCSAESVGIFRVFVDDGSGESQVLQFRNNITNLNVIVSNEMPMVQVDSGSVITLYAENMSTPATSVYEGTLMGYNQPTV
jgi:hypothetical protein